MTVQEILLMDSTVTVQIGVNQLQKLLNTLKHFKGKAEEYKDLLEQVQMTNYHLLIEQEKFKQEKVELLKEMVKLENTTFRVRKISDIDLGDL